MENTLTLIAFTLALAAIPGPNVALIVAGSLTHGTRYGLATVAGTTLGVGLQLILVVTGLSALLALVADALVWMKWAGVLYLIYLGVKSLRSPAPDLLSITARPEHTARLFWRGTMIAILNPKTLLFNAAFLPQFVSNSGNAALSLLVVAVVFLLTLSIADALWAILAGRARPYMLRFATVANRVTGGLFLIAAGGLALSQSK